MVWASQMDGSNKSDYSEVLTTDNATPVYPCQLLQSVLYGMDQKSL